MTFARKKYLINNYFFVTALALLVLNDHFLKWEYSNFITGKLSDICGIFLLHLLLAFLFPAIRNLAVVITAILFTWWKSPLSDSFIDFYNQLSLLPICRVIDWTDLFALAVLPASQWMISNEEQFKRFSFERVTPVLVIIPCCFAFMATSPPTSYYLRPRGDILIDRSFVTKLDSASLFSEIRKMGIEFHRDTSIGLPTHIPAFVIKNLVISKQDTIYELHFQVAGRKGKSIVYLNSVNVNGTAKLNNWRTLRWYTKFYRKQVKKYLINPLAD